MDHEKTLRRLVATHGLGERYTWLDHLTYSEAFLVCIGAGPWKIGRRQLIQDRALAWLRGRDLGDVPFQEEPPFPLAWQQNNVACLRHFLFRKGYAMEDWCYSLRNFGDWRVQNKDLFDACGSPNGSKALRLFLRDKVHTHSFPIDRHVKRFLQLHKLPTNEEELVCLCLKAGLDPCAVATMMIRVASGDTAGTFNPVHQSRVSA